MTAAGIARRIAAANVFDSSSYVPFVCDDRRIGWVRRDLVAHLSAHPGILRVTDVSVEMTVGGTPAHRSEAMARVAESLAEGGLLTSWRNELYEVGGSERGTALFALERAAVRFFGFEARAVHLNGLVAHGERWSMWVGRRSPFKAIDPGMYDNLMGGGVAQGISVAHTLLKEAWEEAGIPETLARKAVPAGTLSVRREVPDGLHAETLYVYDLELPGDFRPRNQDGEVVEFRRLTFEEVVAELAADAPYTVDAGLVAIDCLQRRGALPQ